MVRYPENDEDPGGTEGDEEAEAHSEEAGVEGVESTTRKVQHWGETPDT